MSIPAASLPPSTPTPPSEGHLASDNPVAYWRESDAQRWRASSPRAALVLDANRRPSAVVTSSRDVNDLEPHARYAIVGADAHELRGALAARDVIVLDSWPAAPHIATGEVGERLLAIVNIVAQAIPDGVIVGITELYNKDPDVEADMALKPLDGQHPYHALLGFEAPPEWDAIGVVSAGRTAPLPGSQFNGRQPVLSAQISTRNNEEVAWFEIGGARTVPTETAVGRVPDVIRRALGASTPPPPGPTDVLFAQQWLGRVAKARCRTWPEAASLHPATELLDLGADHLIEAAGALGRVCSWDNVRDHVIKGSWQYDDLSTDDAAWMDAGMISREFISPLPAMKPYLEKVKRNCGDAVFTKAKRVLRALAITDNDLSRWRWG